MGDRNRSAYGGPGWSPRTGSTRDELQEGKVWTRCGVENEYARLRSVLLHRPGLELESVTDPDRAQMLSLPNPDRARRQHDGLAEAYRDAGVEVHLVKPAAPPPPNLMFVADLLFMTPEGAIVGRPASTVRAGEERWVAARLAELGIPILRTVRGTGTFEGADAMWIASDRVLLATGLRTNREGAAQVTSVLREAGVDVIEVELLEGAMHLMGTLRIVASDLALFWPNLVPGEAVDLLRKRGMAVHAVPDLAEAERGMALNGVTLGPRRLLMASGNPATRRFYENLGIECSTVELDELHRAAGGAACLTGVLERE